MPPPRGDSVDRFRRALDKGGLAGVERAIGRVQKQAETAVEPFEKLAALLDDPRMRRAAGDALAAESALKKLNAQTRERLSLEARRASIVSGAYGTELRAQQLIARERERRHSSAAPSTAPSTGACSAGPRITPTGSATVGPRERQPRPVVPPRRSGCRE